MDKSKLISLVNVLRLIGYGVVGRQPRNFYILLTIIFAGIPNKSRTFAAQNQ